MVQFGAKGSFGKMYLGDVSRAALRSLGTHGPPKLTQMPMIDEQKWELECETEEVRMFISSRHYWGFGLFSKCFLNKIVIEGPLQTRARCAMDIVASLGRNPWEPVRVRAFERVTSGTMSEHNTSWEGLMCVARESMSDDISRIQDSIHKMRGIDQSGDEILDSADEDLNRARRRLQTRTPPQ